MIIDRRIACISSNNIQDRVNLEMNLHLEGPVVDAFYDMALLSWSEAMDPPLPLLDNPAARVAHNGRTCFEEAKARKGTPGGVCARTFPDVSLQRTWLTLRTLRCRLILVSHAVENI